MGGGNDINYVGGLDADSNSTYTVTGLATRYGGVLDALHAKSANAHIVVVTYLPVLGKDVIAYNPNTPTTDNNTDFTAARVAYHQSVFQDLRNATLEAIVGREEWAEVLDVTGAGWSHGLGSQAPWMNGTGAEVVVPYHPRKEGHVAVANMLYNKFVTGDGSTYGNASASASTTAAMSSPSMVATSAGRKRWGEGGL